MRGAGPYHSAFGPVCLPQPRKRLLGEEGDDLAVGGPVVGREAAAVQDGFEGRYAAAGPCGADGMADGALHTAGGGAEVGGYQRVQRAGQAVQIVRVLQGQQRGLQEKAVAVQVGRNANLQQHGCHVLLGGFLCLRRFRDGRHRGAGQRQDVPGQAVHVRRLNHVVGSAQLHGAADEIVPVQGGQRNDLGPVGGLQVGQALQHAKAVQLRHYHVAHQHLRAVLAHQLQGLQAIGCRAHQQDARPPAQLLGQRLPHMCAVLRHHNTNRFHEQRSPS